MVELVTVIAITTILITLLLIGILAARERSRRVACQNNLHQFGIALSNFSSRHSAFPMGEDSHFFPAHVHLLNDLDQHSIASQFDLTVDCHVGTNAQLYRVASPAVFRCPSDPIADVMSSSYATCSGKNAIMVSAEMLSETQMVLPNSKVSEGLGAFEWKRAVPLSDFQDGLSYTVAFAEVRVGTDKNKQLGSGRPYNNIAHLATMEPHDIAASNYFAHVCAQVNNSHAEWLLSFSRIWYMAGTHDYNHILPPNHHIPDCGRGLSNLFGVRTSRSYHPGGVAAVWGDGHVTFESNSIDLQVWRSISTRAGAENAIAD